MEDFIKAVGVLAVAAIAFAIFFALPIMWLWNYSLVGTIDGVHQITFGKALGITVLIGLLTYKPTNPTSKWPE